MTRATIEEVIFKNGVEKKFSTPKPRISFKTYCGLARRKEEDIKNLQRELVRKMDENINDIKEVVLTISEDGINDKQVFKF